MGNQFLEVAIETAVEAGGILLSEFDKPVKISYKGEVDLVTQADRRSEEAIVGRLRNYFPAHTIVAEEGGGRRRMHAIAGLSTRWMAPPTSHMAIPVSLFPSDSRKTANSWRE